MHLCWLNMTLFDHSLLVQGTWSPCQYGAALCSQWSRVFPSLFQDDLSKEPGPVSLNCLTSRSLNSINCWDSGSILASEGDLSASAASVLFLSHSAQLEHSKVSVLVGKEAVKPLLATAQFIKWFIARSLPNRTHACGTFAAVNFHLLFLNLLNCWAVKPLVFSKLFHQMCVSLECVT